MERLPLHLSDVIPDELGGKHLTQAGFVDVELLRRRRLSVGLLNAVAVLQRLQYVVGGPIASSDTQISSSGPKRSSHRLRRRSWRPHG